MAVTKDNVDDVFMTVRSMRMDIRQRDMKALQKRDESLARLERLLKPGVTKITLLRLRDETKKAA